MRLTRAQPQLDTKYRLSVPLDPLRVQGTGVYA
jgi:hypothetical protein